MKNRKAKGKDRIANKLLKYCVAAMTEQRTSLIGKIIECTKILDEWKTRRTCSFCFNGGRKLHRTNNSEDIN